jgi:hypothetical protein
VPNGPGGAVTAASPRQVPRPAARTGREGIHLAQLHGQLAADLVVVQVGADQQAEFTA